MRHTRRYFASPSQESLLRSSLSGAIVQYQVHSSCFLSPQLRNLDTTKQYLAKEDCHRIHHTSINHYFEAERRSTPRVGDGDSDDKTRKIAP